MPEKSRKGNELNLDDLFLDIRKDKDKALKELQSLFPAEKPEVSAGGIFGALDLSDELRDVYLCVVKLSDVTEEELSAQFPDRQLLRVYLEILVQQKYLQKEEINGRLLFSAVHEKTAKKTVSDDIWSALDDES